MEKLYSKPQKINNNPNIEMKMEKMLERPIKTVFTGFYELLKLIQTTNARKSYVSLIF